MESIESLKILFSALGEVTYTIEQLEVQLKHYRKHRIKILEKINEYQGDVVDRNIRSQEHSTEQEAQ